MNMLVIFVDKFEYLSSKTIPIGKL